MKDIGVTYYDQSETMLTSFESTLKEVGTLTEKYKNNTRKLTTQAGNQNQETVKTLNQQFDDMHTRLERANDVLQRVKGVCEPVTSVISWLNPKNWFRKKKKKKSCFGHQIPNLDPTRVTNIKAGNTSVRQSLRGILDLVEPNSDVNNFTISGKL